MGAAEKTENVLMDVDDVKEYMGISEATLYRYIKKGDVPKPMKLGCNKWRRVDIIAAVDRLAQLANAGQQ